MASIVRQLGASFLFSLALLVPVTVFAVDSDNDGLSDEEEALYYTDPTNADTDGDGFMDGEEVENGFSPLAASSTRMHEYDHDGDGLNDWLEGWFATDRGVQDTDGDGYSDYDEVMYGYSPTDPTPLTRFERRLVVDKRGQRLYVYVDGVKIHNYPVSTGNPGMDTPTGTFEIQRKVDVKDYVGPGYYVPDVWWSMQFKPMYYIHGAYWHNDFGVRTHSHGCVNMRPDDAEALYPYVNKGMRVEIEGETPVGGVVRS